MKGNVKCSCGHSWSKSDSSKKDANVCHICGKDNTMKDGGWLDKYQDGGPIQPNYNDANASAGPGFQGDGYSNVGRNYSPAWGGQFKDGGEVQPIYVTDKKDPRLKAYNDSLDVRNRFSQSFAPGSKTRPLTKKEQAFWKDKKTGLIPNLVEYIPKSGKDEGYFGHFKKPTQPVEYKPEPTPQSTIDFMEGNYAQEPITEIPQVSAYGEVVDPRTGYTHMTRQGSSMYPMVGQNVPEMAMGGSMPGAVGFMYARTNDPAPSNGKYAKKTKASAQNGTEMEYYQNGLDWKPRSMAKGGNLYTGKDPKKFDKNVAKSDETKKSPAINYRSTADSERIAREKELARRQTSVSAYDQKGMSPEVRKSVGEAMENKRVYDDRVKKFADVTQILGAGLEVAAPFTGPAAPALGAIGAGLGAGSSAYLAGKDAMAGDYKSALTNAAFGGLDVAGFSAIRNMGLKNAVSAADQVSDFGQVTDPSQLENLNIFAGKAPRGSFSSLVNETKGRFNPKAKQSIEEGNQWLQNWVDHPATQQKIDDIFDSNFGLNTMSNLSREAYDRLKNYTANVKAYPLKAQAKDFLDLTSKGTASKEGYREMVHGSNRGVSYTHHRMPGDKPDHERFGNWTSLSPDMNEIERASTTVHEGTHDWLRKSTLNVLGYDVDVLQSLDPDVQRVVLRRRQLEQTGHSDEDIRRIMGENDYGVTYFANPSEVHARTMEIRNAFDIKPNQKVTAKDWEEISLFGSNRQNKIHPFHFKMFDSNQAAADLMNRLLVAPAAVGVGAAAVANQPEMEQGGQLTKLDQLTNFTNYNTKQPGGWLDKYES